MSYAHIKYELDGPVAIVTLNRPEVMNAMSLQQNEEMHAAFDEADQNPKVRSIVLTGAGKAFCAGADMGQATTDGSLRRSDPGKRSMEEFIAEWYESDARDARDFMRTWHMSTPVIAAVNGWAMGYGFWVQLMCDITIASDRAVFGQPEVRNTANTSYMFAALCGWKHANRYALTGDHFDAAEALRIGLVNQVVPHDELMPTTMALAKRIALVPEASVRLNKATTMLGMKVSGVQAGMTLNGALSALVHSSYGPDRERLFEAQRQGGVRAFIETRDAPFKPEPFGPKAAKTSK